MKNPLLTLLLLVAAMAMSGCVTHTGAPATAIDPPPMHTRYSVRQAVTYTPAQWPAAQAADVYVPEGTGPWPGVLMVHGGGWVTGDRDIMRQLSEQLASHGYVVMNVDYRLAPRWRHPAQIEDLREALRWMRTNAGSLHLAPDHIGAWGYSAGAHLVALLGTDGEPPETRVQAVVAGGLPSNLSDFPNGPLVQALMGVTRDADPEAWAQASPYALASRDAAPMFIYHGTWDTTVRVGQAQKMQSALTAAGAPVELYLVHGAGHNTIFLFGFGAESAAIGFLDRYLRR